MKILVVGAGSIGKRHHENLLLLGADSALLPYSEFSRNFTGSGAKHLRQWDGAVVATATHIRLEVIGSFAAAGVPLYIEKPVSFRPQDVLDIAQATRGIASRSMVGFMMRYHPAFRYLGDRDLADVYSFAFEVGHDVRLWRNNWSFKQSYAARADGGGALLDLCHELDMASFLFPRARELRVRCLGHDDYPGVDFCTSIQLFGPATPIGSVSMDYVSPVLIRRVTVRGRENTFDFDFAKNSYVCDAGKGPVHLALRCERNELFLSAMRDFLDVIAGRSVSDEKYAPRLDRVMESCRTIARAWDARGFTGTIAGEFD